MQPRPEFIKQTAQSGRAVCILLLEDDPISVDIVGAYLQAISFADVKLHSAATAAEALALLARVDVDLVVADLNLPDSAGAATVASHVAAFEKRFALAHNESPPVGSGPGIISDVRFSRSR